ncbi:MFS transporter [Spirillospora sp. NPDC048911]|uniref:MFS transporter n=1 Tax=Spirillospora sp. NPDC048911 TaxID=3364527 RepID=UPI003713B8A2
MKVRSWAAAPIMRLAASIFILGIGTGLVLVGLPLLVLKEYSTGFGLGLVIALRILPNFLLGPSVGGIIDSRDPLRVAVIASVASAAFTVLVPLTTALWQLCLLALALGLTSMFTGPARMALRSWLIPEGREMDGNGAIVTAERVPDVLGPAMVGPLLLMGSLDWLFFMGGLLTVLACVPLLGLGSFPRQPTASRESPTKAAEVSGLRRLIGRLFTDNARSLAEVVRMDGTLTALTITGFTYVFALGVGRIFLSEYSIKHFPSIDGALGYLMAAMAFGGVIGGIAAPRLKRVHPCWLYFAGNILEGVCWLMLPFVPSFAVASALMVLAGVLESAATVVFFAEVQIRLPASFGGRYYAMLLPLTDACMLLGSVVGGAVVLAGLPWAALVICVAMAAPIIMLGRLFLNPTTLPIAHTPQEQAN